ncbi:hypothetical protein NLG97_g4804 [Lecanicillium saksenae]|uniref:Uncharacterized protein n=1 Tax=Lecanicillium saksenae TaxID=468837 RepID=A0ACC1QUE8_9HYPO|nr:hypothetical protein NLG97_g4804 [Lecanicillium saksenae]
MSLPLAVAVPAALGAAAYLNAKSALWYDALMLRGIFRGVAGMAYGGWTDRLNLFYALEGRAASASHANKPALLFDGTTYTYSELYDRVLRYGNYLRSEVGIRPGDVVAMDFQNSDAFIFIWWGLWSIGAKPAFINYNLTSKPLAHCVKAATASVCLVDADTAKNFEDEVVRKEAAGVQVVVFDEARKAAASRSEPVRRPDSDRSDKAPGSMGILIYTSGTTGLPKPAIVSWAKLHVSSMFSVNLLGRGNDIMYTRPSSASPPPFSAAAPSRSAASSRPRPFGPRCAPRRPP